MQEMVEVMVDSVRVSLTNQQRIVLLRELASEFFLPIWVGPYEAEAITTALQEIEIARPQTHDLLLSVFNQLHGRLVRVEVTALRGDVFYGNLVVDTRGEEINIDSRPSDAIALAVRAHVPIFVSRDILIEAGISPEKEVKPDQPEPDDISEGPAPAKPEVPEEPEASGRLSVFEDFLQNIDLDDLNDKPDKEEPPQAPPDKDKPPKKKK